MSLFNGENWDANNPGVRVFPKISVRKILFYFKNKSLSVLWFFLVSRVTFLY